MKFIQAAALSFLWISGALSTACAHAQEPPPAPPFGEAPPRQEKDSEDRRRHVQRLEERIREIEGALKNKELSDEHRKELSVKLDRTRAELRGVLADGKPLPEPRADNHERIRRLEATIHELKSALETMEGTPEDRKKLESKLESAHAELRKLRATPSSHGPGHDPLSHERLGARLRAIDEILKKGVGPEDQKELLAEKNKIHDMLRRFAEHQHGGQPAAPHDPEMLKLHRQLQELDRQSMDLSAKLRSIPKENKDDRAGIVAKLKETVTQLFDLREKARAREVELIKTRLEELTQLLEKRKANRDAIIEKRIKQLSGEADDLDW